MSAIYLDNAATTRVAPEVAAAVARCMTEDFGNPASAHVFGVNAERCVTDAAAGLSAAIGDDHGIGSVLWTSGGTESDALGLIGAARARRKRSRRIVVSAIEHSAVLESAKLLADESFDITVVPVDAQGRVDVAEFAAACEDAAVACLMLVNNELGTVEPVSEVTRVIKERNPEVHVHCDAVQALGKLPVDVLDLGVDSLAVAAHKLHGPKGVGALWLRKGSRIEPLWRGGGQQRGLRSGTLNVPGIVGFGEATRLALDSLEIHQQRWSQYAEHLLDALKRSSRPFAINSAEHRAPHILSLAFEDIPAEPLLHVLESRSVLVSAGSACSERKRRASHVLDAIGSSSNQGVLRISFGRFTNEADITRAAEILVESLQSF